MDQSNRIETAINWSGLDKTLVAELLSVTSETMDDWLNGRARIDTTHLEGLAKLIGINSEWLQFGQGDSYDFEDQDFLQSQRHKVEGDPNILMDMIGQGPLSDESVRSIAEFISFAHEKEDCRASNRPQDQGR